MAKKTKRQQRLEEKINFLKFDLSNGLDFIQKELEAGKVISAYERFKALKQKFFLTFPFRYGSEMDAKGYSDEKVFNGED